MNYRDNIYGPEEITDPVLLALLETAAIRRLQGVLQHGVSALIGLTSPITRFEHSMGVMLLVRRLGGDLEEQIAALLHDASHTAFSHVIDYVFDDHDNQSYHDEQKEAFLTTTDLPQTLAEYGYDWQQFLDETAYSLLEQPAPRLCADRLDYFLRDSISLGLGSVASIREVLADLVVVHDRIAVETLERARWLGYQYCKADDASWANFKEVGIYELTARAIRRGLEIGAIRDKDIWGTDRPLWQKLHTHPDLKLQRLLSLVHPETEFAWDEKNPTFTISTKIRTIDPEVALGGELYRLSRLDPAFARFRADYLARKEGDWPMRVIPRPGL